MSYKQAAEQNLRVWARRLNVDSEKLPAMARNMHKSFPGSVLKGPLSVVVSAHLMETIPSLNERRPVAIAVATVLSNHLRGENTDNFCLELALAWPSREMVPYLQLMLDTINHALAQRQAERDKPNLANMVINHVRGRG